MRVRRFRLCLMIPCEERKKSALASLSPSRLRLVLCLQREFDPCVLSFRELARVVAFSSGRRVVTFVIDTGVLFCLLQLLTQSHPKTIKKDACWVISNITAGNKAQIQAVLDVNIIPPLVHLLEHAEFDIKREAAWAISNAITGGSFEQVRILASGRCIKPLCDLLTCPDTSVVIVCLEALENILKVGKAEKYLGNNDGINPFAHEFEDCEGLDKIENLQSHDNEDIYKKAINILEKYLDEEEEEGENLRGSGDLNCGFESGLNAASARKFEFF